MARVFIALGSNLSNPVSQLQQAIQSLGRLEQTSLISTSSFYRSLPMGPPDQPDYINAVVCLETALEPLPLLDSLQHIEQQQGRVRTGERWGPRKLDLDILLYDEQIISNDRLIIPHPGLHERSFVLYPLQEIAPELEIPGHGQLARLVAKCDKAGLEQIDQV